MELHEQAIFRMGSASNFSGSVRLGCSEGFVAQWIFPVVRSFLLEHPGIDVQLNLGITTDLNEAVRRGTLDIVVGPICEHIEGAELLWSESLQWAYPKNREPDWKNLYH